MFFWTVLLLLCLAPTAAHAQQVNTFGNDVRMCSGRPWIDVTCNGADPTGAGDSTSAINTTVNAAITNNWPVFFPAGTYKITSKLTWDYQGQAGGGLEVLSRGATIDGRTIASGNVLQVQCSGGTIPAPMVCHDLRISGQLTVLGSTSSYVVVIGKTDFSDRHDSARLEHLIVVNNSTGGGAGAVQLNYVTGSKLWLSGSTSGGSSSTGAVAFEQVQISSLSGYASALGASAPGLLIENGASTGNSVVGFEYDPNDNTCVSVTTAAAVRNTWLVPVFGCNTAINMLGSQNILLGPSFVGANVGPTSPGAAIVGRGSLSRFAAPAVSSLTLTGADDGTIFSSANGTGFATQFTAASLPITLPNPSSVGVGWTAGFVTDSGKAVVLTAASGKILAGDRQITTMTVGASGTTGAESAVLASDGTNFRVIHLSQAAAMLNGVQTAFTARWIYPGGPGYQATGGDNGNVVSSAQATTSGLSVTLPSTTGLQSGYMIGLSVDNGTPITLILNSVAGGQFYLATGVQSTSPQTFAANNYWTMFQFDGSSGFRQVLQPPPRPNNVVTPDQFKLPSDPDDTNSIIKALASCNAVELRAGVTYTVSGLLPLCSGGNQHVFGHSGSVIRLAPSWNASQHAPCSAASDGATWRAVFYNVNCGGATHTYVDRNFHLNNFTIDATAVPTELGQTIALFFRNTQYVDIDEITCIAFADCTAILGSQFTTVSNSRAIESENAGFDFWDSPLDAAVINDTTYCDGPTYFGQYGFLFNASDTTSTHDGNGINYTSIGSRSVGCGTSLFIDPLTANGSITGVTVTNYVADGKIQNFGGKSGIVIWGNVIGAQLSNIVVQNLVDGQAVYVGVDNGKYPISVAVQGLKILNAAISTLGAAPIILHEGGVALGTGRITNVTFGPPSFYSATPRFQYPIDADTTGQMLEGQFPTNGSLGLAKNYPSQFPHIINLNYAPVTLGQCGVSPTVTGISAAGSVTVGSTATGLCTILFPNDNVFAFPPICAVTPSNVSTYTGIVNVTTSVAGINLYGSSDMQGKTFMWQCNPQ